MRKILTALFLFALLSFPLSSYGNSVSGDVIVVLRNTSGYSINSASTPGGIISLSAVQSFTQSAKVQVTTTYDALSDAGDYIFMLVHSDTKNENDLLREIRRNPNVIAASLNYTLHLNDNGKTPNDHYYPLLWGMEAIKAPDVWNINTGSDDVYVAVMDSGIDPDHEDLRDNFSRQYSRNFLGQGEDAYDATAYQDDTTHGTHCAGTIAAVGNNSTGVAGVNWKAKIIALKVADKNGMLETSSIIAALNYLTGLLRQNPDMKLAAVNMSFGGRGESTPQQRKDMYDPQYIAMKALSDTNRTIMCVSAGNENLEVGVPTPYGLTNNPGNYVYPASYIGIDNMIVVAAANPDLTRANFSNYSRHYVDIAAPGVGILSTVPSAISSDVKYDFIERYYNYGLKDGTSMAAPHVTGAVALLKAIYPNASASEIKAAIVGGADSTYMRNDNSTMYGFLNLKGAFDFMAACRSGDMPPSITPITPHASSVNQPYNLEFYASGTKPITWSFEGELPEGLSFDNGKITGTPTKDGMKSFIVTAENNYGYDSLVLEISIDKGVAPVMSLDNEVLELPVNDEVRVSFSLSEGSWPITWSIKSSDLPSSFGLSIDAGTGVMTFTPDRTGAYTFTVKASNYAGTDSKDIAFMAVAAEQDPPEIHTDELPSALKGVIYGAETTSYKRLISLGLAPAGHTVSAKGLGISWDVDGLPEGMAFSKLESGTSDTGTIVITGRPAEVGSFDVTVIASNDYGIDSKDFILSVEEKAPKFADRTLILNYQRGVGTVIRVLNIAGSEPMSFDVKGSIPDGLYVSHGRGTAMLEGIPARSGEYKFVIYASNDVGIDSVDITVTVKEPVYITTNSLPDGIKGKAYNFSMSSMYDIPLSWDISAGISGLVISRSGDITGTPDREGVFGVTVKAASLSDRASYYNRQYQLVIREAPKIRTSSLPDGTQNTPYTQTTLSADGTAPVVWSVSGGAMPRGLVIASNGYIRGTPTEYGTFTFTLKATNQAGNSTKSFTLNIASDGTGGTGETDTADNTDNSGSTGNTETTSTDNRPDNQDNTDDGTTRTETAKITHGSSRSLSSLSMVEYLKLTSNDSKIGAILPEISVNVSGFYTYESNDVLAGVKISSDVPAGYLLVWNAFERPVTSVSVYGAEDRSAVFYDTDGEVITAIPENHTVNISAWLDVGKTYAPVVSAVSASGDAGEGSSNSSNIGSSGGGCNAGGMWLAAVIIPFGLAFLDTRAMKVFIVAFLVLWTASSSFAAEYVDGQALVVIRAPEGMEISEKSVQDGAVKEYLNGIALSANGRIAAVYGALSAAGGGQKILAFIVSDTATTEDIVKALKSNPCVISASPNYRMHTNRAM